MGEPEQMDVARVSANLLPLLGVRPRLGRLFREDEDQRGRKGVVLIGEALWIRRFGGDRGIRGRSIALDGAPRVVVGVVPASFHLPNSAPGQMVSLPSRAEILCADRVPWRGARVRRPV